MSHRPLKGKPICFIDVETTGLNPTFHEVIEYAVIVVEPDGDAREFHRKVVPQFIERAHPKALEVNGYTPEKWKDAISPEEAAQRVSSLLEDVVVVGHCVHFDVDFLTEMLKRAGIDRRIDHHLVDTASLAWEHLVPCGLESLSLTNICKFLGVEPGGHTALGDARACKRVYKCLLRANWMDRLRWKWKRRV